MINSYRTAETLVSTYIRYSESQRTFATTSLKYILFFDINYFKSKRFSMCSLKG